MSQRKALYFSENSQSLCSYHILMSYHMQLPYANRRFQKISVPYHGRLSGFPKGRTGGGGGGVTIMEMRQTFNPIWSETL